MSSEHYSALRRNGQETSNIDTVTSLTTSTQSPAWQHRHSHQPDNVDSHQSDNIDSHQPDNIDSHQSDNIDTVTSLTTSTQPPA
ncbi:hypothetical protein ACJMK2_024976 [Sinanodonta woodiana]|uniref:Uncharacterized protein n=1 Tax=Sinanodonta woodiana TaxID=1069815 RepID=A0ABD3XH19_SINWO